MNITGATTSTLRKRGSMALCFAWLCAASSTPAQSSFQNLDFEAAVVPNLPPDQTAFISFTNAFPGWTRYVDDTNLAGVAGYNGISIGAHLVSLVDGHTFFYSNRVIEGYFTAVIQSGDANPPVYDGPAAIAQTGLIPASARSVLFSASAGTEITNFFLALNGQGVPFFPLDAGANFVTYGANISAFSGQTAELRFTSRPSANNLFTTVFLDDIRFSDMTIPEPRVLSLLALGALLLGWRWARRPRVRPLPRRG